MKVGRKRQTGKHSLNAGYFLLELLRGLREARDEFKSKIKLISLLFLKSLKASPSPTASVLFIANLFSFSSHLSE